MKVRELIAALQDHDLDSDVYFAYPSGDHWRTTIAAPVSYVEDMPVKHSAYHDKMVLDEGSEPENYAVVIQS
jgi:hypothetical protein